MQCTKHVLLCRAVTTNFEVGRWMNMGVFLSSAENIYRFSLMKSEVLVGEPSQEVRKFPSETRLKW